MTKKKGFTLIELLIVIAIIGIVAAIAIPNLLTALQKGKQKATMGDMKSIGTAVESYITDNYMSPGAGAATSVAGLQVYLIPFHTKVLPTKDAWGGDYVFQAGTLGTTTQDYYSIISYGRRSTSTGIDIANNNYPVSSMTHFENDICFSNGNFTYGPKVK
ncbi:MAG: prepilin-type N-terminal cleavage/methylation domain-containing protein [bacterium]|nr:prepilin-type N-terminal cleavage/methylation domain-containing protein [bacterium]